MTKELLFALLNEKAPILLILILLTSMVYILGWFISFKLAFRILRVDVNTPRFLPAVFVMYIYSLSKPFLPLPWSGLLMSFLMIFLIMMVSRGNNINIIRASWASLLIILLNAATDIFVLSPLALIQPVASFLFKTTWGNIIVGFTELLGSSFVLFILKRPRFNNLSLIPVFKIKVNKLDLSCVIAFFLSFYWVYGASMRLLENLREKSRLNLGGLVSEWIAALGSVFVYYAIYIFIKEALATEHRKNELNEEKIVKLEAQNDSLAKLYNYYMSDKAIQQGVIDDLKDIKESILSIRDRNTQEITQTRALLQENESSPPNVRLSDRDRVLLRLIAQDKLNKEIAAELFISESTVKKNITDLLERLNLRDRVQLALYALANGVVEKDELNL